MLIYLLCGMFLTGTIELLALYNAMARMSWPQRIFMILLWPIILIFFLHELTKDE